MNADGFLATGQGIPGTNMFAYCGNNPVNRADSTGMLWKSIKSVFEKTWNKVKKWMTNACSKNVRTSKDIPIVDIGENVNLKLGLRLSTTEEKNNKYKPLYLYASNEVDGTGGVSSAIGISCDPIDVSMGTAGVSYSTSRNYIVTRTSTTYSLTSDGHLEYEMACTTTLNDTDVTIYLSESTIWQIPAMALAISCVRWESLPVLAATLQN